MEISANFKRVLKRFGYSYLCTYPIGQSFTNDSNKSLLINVEHGNDWSIFNKGEKIAQGAGSPDLEVILSLKAKEVKNGYR